MLERCFVRPETLGQIRSSWMGQAIEQYAAWLCDRGYREGTLATRVSRICSTDTSITVSVIAQRRALPISAEVGQCGPRYWGTLRARRGTREPALPSVLPVR